MPESLYVNLFPAICLFLSFIFVLCVHFKTISRTLSLCHPSHWSQRRAYIRVSDQETTARIHEATETSPTDPDQSLQAASDSDGDGDPLAKYFDPQTTLLHEHILEPPSPPIATWERELQHRIDNGRGLTAWIDRFVDRAVERVEAAIGQA